MSSTADYSSYDTLTDQTVASERFARLILSPHIIGWMLQTALWGVVISNATSYMQSQLWGRDPKSRKALIIVVLTFCTFQTGMNAYLCWYWGTRQDRSALAILAPSMVNAAQPISVLITGLPTQIFLISRATRLLQRPWARRLSVAVFGFLIVVQTVFQLFNCTLNYLFNGGKLNGDLLSIVTFNVDTRVWLIASALVDVGVTTILVICLKKKMGTSFNQTDGILRRLISISIESASYTAVLAVLAVIVSCSLPADKLEYTSIPFVFWYLLPCCYPLSLLTALRSRLIFDKTGLTSSHSQPNGVPLVRLAGPNSHSGGTSVCTCGARSANAANRASRFRAKLSGVQVDEVVSVVVESGNEELSPRTPTTRFALHSMTIQEDSKMEKGGSDWDSEDGEKQRI